jgi:hypothetical protein
MRGFTVGEDPYASASLLILKAALAKGFIPWRILGLTPTTVNWHFVS